MRDPITSDGSPATPEGYAFEIADLVLVTQWANSHGLRMVIRLDHGASVDEDYEEVIAFQTNTSPLYRLIIWRNADAVFVQPLVGKRRRYGSVAEALSSLSAKQRFKPNDIAAPASPNTGASRFGSLAYPRG